LMTGLVKPSFAATEKPTDLIRCTVVQLADLIRRREVSSLEVVNACLTRIEYVNPKLNAVVMLIPNDARAQARVADQMLANNDAWAVDRSKSL
jgi:amidase